MAASTNGKVTLIAVIGTPRQGTLIFGNPQCGGFPKVPFWGPRIKFCTNLRNLSCDLGGNARA